MSVRLVAFVAALLWMGVLGCTEAPVTVPLRSLERSGDVAFVCRGADGAGRDINACPDFENENDPNHLLALVTQTLRGEVAVVDLSAGGVLDFDHATPGFDFLPVGEQPRDIVSTPDGALTFVGVAGQRPGIFALPTTCLEAPPPDLTVWPSCELPVAPGEMVVVSDPFPQFSCDGGPEPAMPTGNDCPGVNLTERRKLVVALPEMHALAILDTHELAALPPGSFGQCPARYVELGVSLPAGDVPQDIPPDLEAPGCVPPELNHGPTPSSFDSQPAGFALAESTLFVADRAAPVIHQIDLTNPCEPAQLPPLLPKSFETPGRVVTTSRVAVSPVTTKGERFVYAIDELEGSVMVFDISPGKTQRTPLVRPGARRLPFEAADRIAFTAPAQDLTFALRDVPIVNEATGVTTIGTYCDPVPGASPGAVYRPAQDYSSGAAPRELRGVFGFVALTSGQVAVIDVEDFDAPCRRPVSSNSAAEEDFRGCKNDPASPETYVDPQTEQRTTSAEVSCNIVQPHRARSASIVGTSQELGVHAPSLRNFPQLQAPEGGTLPSGGDEGGVSPKLLAVDFVNPEGGTTPAQLFVGTSLYEATASADNPLIIDPALAERSSVALLFNQPRAFAPEEEYTLTYEGAFVPERPAGFLKVSIQDPTELVDADASFCNRGVQDVALTREMGPDLDVAASDLDEFATRHADYVQVTSDLVGKDDPYWDTQGQCGGQTGNAAFFACRNTFGTKEIPNELRDLRILEAYQDRLVLEPRAYSSEAQKNELLELMYCCFGRGKAVEYKVRAGHQWALVGGGGIGFRNDVIADPSQNYRCVRDCNPRRSLLHSRAFEISSTSCTAPLEDEPPPECAIGYSTPADVACVVSGQAPVTPGAEGSACIFENLTHRFAVYRGTQPTLRDSAFTWQIAGGFITLGANLAAQTAAVSPQSLVFVPQIGQLAVVDGAAEGLVLVSLDSVAVSRLFF